MIEVRLYELMPTGNYQEHDHAMLPAVPRVGEFITAEDSRKLKVVRVDYVVGAHYVIIDALPF